METPRSSTHTIAQAMRVLARDIDSEDGVANMACEEAGKRLMELHAMAKQMHDTLLTALPYVETAEHDEGYKRGAVRKVTNQMRKAIESFEVER